MSDPEVTMLAIPMNADPEAFVAHLHQHVFAPLASAYAAAQPDPADAFVRVLCGMAGRVAGLLAASTNPGYAAGLLRSAADSCDALPTDPPPQQAPESARPH